MPVSLPGTLDAIIDINHDDIVDMTAARAAGIAAVIHKASEGATFRDSTYVDRRKAALDAGLLWGAYHFSSGRDTTEQVENFLKATKWAKLSDDTTLLCLDFEPSSSGPDITLEQGQEFVVLIMEKTGRWPMIYGGSLLRESVPAHSADDILKNCPLWYARYRNAPLGIPRDTWPDFTLWQYTDGKNGPEPRATGGVKGADRNCFRGTVEELQSQWPFADYHKSAPRD